tara:strand:+ start:380 stop:709 length:330 start_codon:yes stop_codon:yes gene_type:complete
MAATEFSKPDKTINLKQLQEEITALGLPSFAGVGVHLERRGTPPEGAVSPPYISVRSAALNNSQKTSISTVIADHSARTDTDSRITRYAAASTNTAKLAILAQYLGFTE